MKHSQLEKYTSLANLKLSTIRNTPGARVFKLEREDLLYCFPRVYKFNCDNCCTQILASDLKLHDGLTQPAIKNHFSAFLGNSYFYHNNYYFILKIL